jgi:hypothetical protein
MKSQLKAPRLGYKFQLVKLEGNVTEAVTDPKNDPRCTEIREWTLGQPNHITYKKDGE